MISDLLKISPLPGEDGVDCRFECSGCIDVRADEVLNVLREVPAGSRVCLDFKNVERVNSMGLSLLLKIFQDWEQHGTRVEVIHLNRMVGMLFKITGLGGYIGKGAAAASTPTASAPAPQASTPRRPAARSSLWDRLKTGSRAGAAEPGPAASPEATQIPASAGTLQLYAGITNSLHRSGWLALSTYLQRHLKTPIRLEPCRRPPDASVRSVDFYFSAAFDACSLIDSRGMLPVMQADGNAEQVVILSASDDMRALSAHPGSRVAVASRHSLVYCLGREILDDRGVDSESAQYVFAGNEIRALQMLIRRQVDLAFVMLRTYEGLSSFSRDSTRVVEQSNVSFSCPLFCVGGHLQALLDPLRDALGVMEKSENGRKILGDIQIRAWSPSRSTEMDRLGGLIKRYSGG